MFGTAQKDQNDFRPISPSCPNPFFLGMDHGSSRKSTVDGKAQPQRKKRRWGEIWMNMYVA
jgi:hypothetical protein